MKKILVYSHDFLNNWKKMAFISGSFFCFLLWTLIFQQLIIGALLFPNSSTTKPSSKLTYKSISLPTTEIIRNNGYTVETHSVVTEDGYVLELHRIPKSRSGQLPTRNFPVFLHHAFLSSSDGWVFNGANTSLAMQLADDGYDVWMTNCRGNTYSRKHVTLSPKQKAFWNFSFHELGKYDIPAAIDYVLAKTNSSQLHYIGYSMGTTLFFIFASERPEYQHKIRSQISLAPVVYLTHMKSPIRRIAPYANILSTINQMLSSGLVFPHTKMTKLLTSLVCGQGLTQKYICEKGLLFLVAGSDPYLFDTKTIPYLLGHYPTGTSSKIIKHFAQIILKDRFAQYDYGRAMNMKRYNSTKPPLYNISSVQVPITFFYGKNDRMSAVEDVMRLKDQLPKMMDAVLVNNSYCNHLDFVASLKVNEHINDPVRGVLHKTDALDWAYRRAAGPANPGAIDGPREDQANATLAGSVQPTSAALVRKHVSSLDYSREHLGEIVTKVTPRSGNEKDVVKFKRERESQKNLFRNLIGFLEMQAIAKEHSDGT